MIGGMAHLINFQGTDNLEALLGAQEYYNAPANTVIGFSIPAAEHSTITSWGRENESQAYSNMLAQFSKPGSLVAVVSDSYDLFNAIDNIWGKALKEQIIKSGGTLVVRPDSGHPPEIVLKSLQLLEKNFGATVNSKGYKVLPDCVRLIQGDGINLESLSEIIDVVLTAGYSLDNLAFGMGGGLLQQVNRDTMGWAMKASAAYVNGEWRDVFKDPITSASKRSKKGRLGVLKQDDGTFSTVRYNLVTKQKDLLKEVYRDGKVLVNEDFQTIRQRVLSTI